MTITNFQLSSVVDPVTDNNRVISGERPQDVEFSLLARYRKPEVDVEDRLLQWLGRALFPLLEETQHRRVLPPYMYVYWEYKPTPDWSLHFELDNLGQFVYENEYFDFAGERNSIAIAASPGRPHDQSPSHASTSWRFAQDVLAKHIAPRFNFARLVTTFVATNEERTCVFAEVVKIAAIA